MRCLPYVLLTLILWMQSAWRWAYRRLVLETRVAIPFSEISGRLCGVDVPSHVGAVVPNGTSVDTEALAHMLSWAAGAGCSFATVYQEEGALRHHADALGAKMDALKDVSFPRRCVEIRVWDDGKGWMSTWVGSVRGEQALVVHLLSKEDASDDLVMGALRSLAREVQAGKLNVDDITSDHISRKLRLQVQDPQLVFLFDGPTRNGFLPWHIRVTEFFECSELRDFRFSHFVASLCKFAQVEQRYGA